MFFSADFEKPGSYEDLAGPFLDSLQFNPLAKIAFLGYDYEEFPSGYVHWVWRSGSPLLFFNQGEDRISAIPDSVRWVFVSPEVWQGAFRDNVRRRLGIGGPELNAKPYWLVTLKASDVVRLLEDFFRSRTKSRPTIEKGTVLVVWPTLFTKTYWPVALADGRIVHWPVREARHAVALPNEAKMVIMKSSLDTTNKAMVEHVRGLASQANIPVRFVADLAGMDQVLAS